MGAGSPSSPPGGGRTTKDFRDSAGFTGDATCGPQDICGTKDFRDSAGSTGDATCGLQDTCVSKITKTAFGSQ